LLEKCRPLRPVYTGDFTPEQTICEKHFFTFYKWSVCDQIGRFVTIEASIWWLSFWPNICSRRHFISGHYRVTMVTGVGRSANFWQV